MLAVTIDTFSGRPNPSRILEDVEATELLRELDRNRGAFGTRNLVAPRMGFRGLTVEFIADGLARRHDLPQVIHLATGNSANEGKAREIAEKLIKSMTGKKGRYTVHRDHVEVTPRVETHLIEQLHAMSGPRSDKTATDAGVHLFGVGCLWAYEMLSLERKGEPIGGQQKTPLCHFEVRAFEPEFWNEPSRVLHNNCYNYATNRRTDSYAQPGRGNNSYIRTRDCAGVSDAALADGLRRRGDCCGDDEKPRWLVALALDLIGEDFHWYRLHEEGFWGHKLADYPASNLDSAGRVIYNPMHCDRGVYTEFCGYFYVPKSVRVE
jgi:hypothetical protein